MSEEKPQDGDGERGPDIRSALVITAVGALLAVAPWPSEPVPHLVQKLGFLAEGSLTKPLDIFDLFMHGVPILVAAVMWVRIALHKLRSDR